MTICPASPRLQAAQRVCVSPSRVHVINVSPVVQRGLPGVGTGRPSCGLVVQVRAKQGPWQVDR